MPLNELAPAAKAVKPEEAGHFYTKNKVTGKWEGLHKEGGTFTLRDARKLKAAGEVVVPSITGLFGLLHKQQLLDWKIEQALKVAAVNPYPFGPEDEPELGQWVDRIASQASGASRGAADLGTRIHLAIESALQGDSYDADLDAYVQAVWAKREQMGLKSIASEICVGSEQLGVAGRCDDLCEGLTVVDYKSRKTKPGKKGVSYETDVMQLAFYGVAHFGLNFLVSGRGLIFVISTTNPGQVDVVEYSSDDIREAYQGVRALADLWRFMKSFDSRS